MERKTNVERHKDYRQVCVWPCTTLGENKPEDFVELFKEQGFRVQFLEEIKTTEPSADEEGYRIDLFFAVHNDDINKFALPRLKMGIRWIEDVLAECNYDEHIYPDRVFEYRTWRA